MIEKQSLELYKAYNEKILRAKGLLKIRRDEFDEENKDLIKDIKDLSDFMEAAKDSIKIQASAEYIETGSKKLTGGIGVRVGKELIYDESVALEWAKEHKLCIKLDKKAFESLAKTQDMEFVNKSDKVTITFPKEIKLEE